LGGGGGENSSRLTGAVNEKNGVEPTERRARQKVRARIDKHRVWDVVLIQQGDLQNSRREGVPWVSGPNPWAIVDVLVP